MHNTEQLLYHTDKSSYRRCFECRNIHRKTPALESLFHRVTDFQACIFYYKETPTQVFSCCKIFKNTYFEEHMRTVVFKMTLKMWLFGILLLDSCFQNHPYSVILQKYPSLSNQSFKHNLVHMSSIYLTAALPFETRFRMFILTVTT